MEGKETENQEDVRREVGGRRRENVRVIIGCLCTVRWYCILSFFSPSTDELIHLLTYPAMHFREVQRRLTCWRGYESVFNCTPKAAAHSFPSLAKYIGIPVVTAVKRRMEMKK